MVVTVSPTRLVVSELGYNVVFYGLDVIQANILQLPAPNFNTVAQRFAIQLTLTGAAKEALGATYNIELQDVTTPTTWNNRRAGAEIALAAIRPMIRTVVSAAGGQVDSVQPGVATDVDATDPVNPIVNVKVDGVTVILNGSNELEAVASGTGDVVGPASAVDSNVALFNGTTGKLIKDGGTLGSAAFSPTGAFDAFGAAAIAQSVAISTASADATTKANAAQAYAIQRANHTGSQLASTVSDFNSAALAAAPAETATTLGARINAAGAATPVDTDLVAMAAAGGLLIKASWTTVKAFLKTYWDTLYAALAPITTCTLVGTPSTTSTSVADIDASVNLTVPGAGYWEVLYGGKYDSAAITTGAGLSLGQSGLSGLSQIVIINSLDTSLADRNVFQWSGFASILAAASSRGTSSNHFTMWGRFACTSGGTVIPKFLTEVGGSAITITSLDGMIRKLN